MIHIQHVTCRLKLNTDGPDSYPFIYASTLHKNYRGSYEKASVNENDSLKPVYMSARLVKDFELR